MPEKTAAAKLLIKPNSTLWLSDESRSGFQGDLPGGVTQVADLSQATAATVFAEVAASLRATLARHKDDLGKPEIALSGRGDASFKPGLYGDGDASDDRSRHRFVVYAFDRKTGAPLWRKQAIVDVGTDHSGTELDSWTIGEVPAHETRSCAGAVPQS